MAAKAAFNFQLTGFPAANRDAEVTLTNTATGQTLKRSPFLDGSLVVRDLDPGLWEAKVTHPNLIQPIFTQKLRLFPQITPTLVPVRIPDVLFQDRPIRDIPDANLGPVQQAVTAARDSLTPVLGKAPGEAIRAGDWNTLASAVRDIADNVLQLTNLVSPRGHDHPEIADKIAEVQQNMRNFSEAFGKSLLELRRELEAEHFRRVLTGVLDEAQAPQATRDDLLGRVGRLSETLQADPAVFTSQLNNTGSRVLGAVADMVAANPALGASAQVQKMQAIAQQYTVSGTTTTADNELKIYNRTNTASGGKLGTVLRN
ncbi:hypothetical protein QTI66_00990 [Variovorax sp. J22R133]|uniref:hypothetical protein n=1 Tax=Variovorax brevis TaxID=3053503 RepID=UPI0025784905|nr:hypothetical protein [Variovorax sp. J22R133]MDM0110701.1 hypothetical protein [Variovorax sp. J22R133]